MKRTASTRASTSRRPSRSRRPGGNVEATLRDLSKGGARFVAPKPVGRVGETIELFLPSLIGRGHHGDGRGHPLDRGQPTATSSRCASTLSIRRCASRSTISSRCCSTATGGGQRSSPRVSRRMDIRFGQLGELRAILEDISRGGLAMTVADPLVLYEDLEVTVPDTIGEQLLIAARARRPPARRRRRRRDGLPRRAGVLATCAPRRAGA